MLTVLVSMKPPESHFILHDMKLTCNEVRNKTYEVDQSVSDNEMYLFYYFPNLLPNWMEMSQMETVMLLCRH